MAADDIVSSNSLATHLGMTCQNVARLTAEAAIEQRSDGCYDQTASRLRYIRHLRDEHRKSPRTEAHATHVAVKTETLKRRLLERQSKLVLRADVDALIDQIAGVTLTAFVEPPARCVPRRDLAIQRSIERVVFEVRTEIANVCQQMANKHGEPALDDDAWVQPQVNFTTYSARRRLRGRRRACRRRCRRQRIGSRHWRIG